jgi:hypothetical protein
MNTERGSKPRRGGARPNSGPKPRAARLAADIARAEGLLVLAVPKAVDCLLKACEQGDVTAARYILDRVLGRVEVQARPLAEAVRREAREIEGAPQREREARIAALQAQRRALEESRVKAGQNYLALVDDEQAPDEARREALEAQRRLDSELAALDGEIAQLEAPTTFVGESSDDLAAELERLVAVVEAVPAR